MVFVGDISIVNGIINQLITGGHHLVYIELPLQFQSFAVRSQLGCTISYPETWLELERPVVARELPRSKPGGVEFNPRICESVGNHHSKQVWNKTNKTDTSWNHQRNGGICFVPDL